MQQTNSNQQQQQSQTQQNKNEKINEFHQNSKTSISQKQIPIWHDQRVQIKTQVTQNNFQINQTYICDYPLNKIKTKIPQKVPRQQIQINEVRQQQPKKFQKIFQKDKLVVLIGIIGSGKTTLFNKICKANKETAAGGNSVTQAIFSQNSAYGNGFRILDTPGLGTQSKKIAHACAIRCALSEDTVNQIFFVVKAERTDLMKGYIRSMTQTFSRFKDIITVVVTHWDNIIKDQAEVKVKEIQKDVTEMISSFNIHSVIFTVLQQHASDLCDEIDKILFKSQAKNTKLTETEFYANFDLIELPDQVELELSKAKEKVTVEFRKTGKVIKKFIQEFDAQHVNTTDIMHALTITIKQWALHTISMFEKSNEKLFSKLFHDLSDINLAYLVHVELKKELMGEVNSLILLAQQKMIVNQDHCLNFIKRCPFCGIIWLKVSGCDGNTTCGNFPPKDERFTNARQHNKYNFYINEGKLNYSENRSIEHLQEKIYNDPGIIKRIGCGKSFIWSEIAPLESYIVKEFLDVGILDFMAREVELEELKLKQHYSLQAEVEKETKKIKIYYD